MILKMSRIFVYGLHSDRKAVLEELHKKEAVEVCEPHSEGVGFQETTKSIAQFEKYMQTAESALAVLSEYCPVKTGFFAGKRSLPIQSYHMASAQSDETLQTIYQIISLNDKLREHRESVSRVAAITAENAADPQIQEYISEIKDCNEHRRDIELFYDHLCLRRDKYQVLSKTGMTEYTFLIEGYVPKKHGEELKQLLESKYAAYVELSEPEKRRKSRSRFLTARLQRLSRESPRPTVCHPTPTSTRTR